MYILSDKIVTTRKPHYCFACLKKFEKGIQMNRQVNTYDGINSIYVCLDCNELITKYRNNFYDEYEHVFHEGCVEAMLQEISYKDLSPKELLIELNKNKSSCI